MNRIVSSNKSAPYVVSGFEQVGASQVFTTHLKTNLPVNKNEYLYIYVSNETPNMDVYFPASAPGRWKVAV